VGRFGGVVVRNEYGSLLFMPEQAPSAAPAGETPVAVPGETIAAGFMMRFWAELVEGPLAEASARFPPGPSCALLDWEKLTPPLVVRPRRAGDSLRPVGLGGTKKVKDILIDAKVPRRLRERVPVVADGEGVVWVVGYALSERARADERSRKILCLEAKPL